MTVAADDLRYWSAVTRGTVLEPGDFDVWVGTDANASLHSTFTLVR